MYNPSHHIQGQLCAFNTNFGYSGMNSRIRRLARAYNLRLHAVFFNINLDEIPYRQCPYLLDGL